MDFGAGGVTTTRAGLAGAGALLAGSVSGALFLALRLRSGAIARVTVSHNARSSSESPLPRRVMISVVVSAQGSNR